MRRLNRRLTIYLGNALLLAACGGGGSDNRTTILPSPPPPPPRGSLVNDAQAVPVTVGNASMSKLEPQVMGTLLDAAQPGTTTIVGTPQCAVSMFKVRYHTVGAQGEATEASAAIMLPSGAAAACSGTRPVLLYAHATSVEQSFDMSQLATQTEARLVAAMFAAQGYIVVAPNYAGYAGSSLAYHPYLDMEQQASDMVDALRAARLSFARLGAGDSGQLFVTGYSQGGYVAVATLRAMQLHYAGEFVPTAVAGMSGPYALAQFGDSIFGGAPRLGTTTFLPLLINAGQHSGAPVYAQASDIFEAPYAATIGNLLPGANTIEQLASAKLLPATALFAQDSLPQGSGSAAFFGAGNLVKTSYRDTYLSDMQANPCGAPLADPLACAPQHALRKLVLKNDLRNFQPLAGLLLCGGSGDPTVPFVNTESAAANWRTRGAANVSVLDIDQLPGLNDPYRTPKLGFAAAKLALRLSALSKGESPGQAVESNYHAGLVPPFCMIATRDYFAGVLAR
jgi:acetyl esterase/lipase